jgi:hypothetical protein
LLFQAQPGLNLGLLPSVTSFILSFLILFQTRHTTANNHIRVVWDIFEATIDPASQLGRTSSIGICEAIFKIMDSSGECLLYAELLANIRQISVAVSLPSPCETSTQVALSADCQTVEVKHGGLSDCLTLPAKASLGATLLPIQDRQKGSTSLSWRLPLDAKSLSPSQQADHMPWSATDLKPSSVVACGMCRAIIVPSGAVESWKDLPSENWAEMMEFWHCHKPDHKHGEDHGEASGKADEKTLAARGYGASSVISAQEGVGFVDLATLLFAESDCQNLTVSLMWSGAVCTGLLLSSSALLKKVLVSGIKKVAKPACTASMAWIPIQMPQIEDTGPFPVLAGAAGWL